MKSDVEKIKHKEYMRIWRANNLDKCRESCRKSKLIHKYKQNPDHQNKYRKNNPDKIFAQKFANKRRIYLLDDECCFCESNIKLELHHPDYSKPELVVTLCCKHHREIHRKS